MILNFSGVPPERNFFSARLVKTLNLVDSRLAESKFLAGEELSAADITIMFTLSTGRGFWLTDLTPYPNILRYLKDIAERPAYKEAMRKGDKGMEPMIAPKVKGFTQFAAFSKALES